MSQIMINTKRSIPQYIIIKLLKAKENSNLESSKGEMTHHVHGNNTITKCDFHQKQWSPEESGMTQNAQRKNLSTKLCFTDECSQKNKD